MNKISDHCVRYNRQNQLSLKTQIALDFPVSLADLANDKTSSYSVTHIYNSLNDFVVCLASFLSSLLKLIVHA